MSDNEASKQPKIGDYLAALKRRRKPVLITAVACVLVTLLLALLLPPYYESTGVILIEQQEVPTELVRSMVSSYADERVQTISQKVMTTQNLLDIIRRYDLYPSERRRESREELIERMRKDIKFKMISADVVDPRSGLPRQATIAFSVSYVSGSPDQAVKVANELATLYLSVNLSERTRLAQDASAFLLDEAGRISKHIEELEAKLAEFKSKHLGALPDSSQLNVQLLDRAEQDLREVELRQMSLQQQRAFLQAELGQIKPNSAIMGEDGQRILTPSDRLKMAKSELASAEALYAPTHPDIVRLKREIAGLEAQEGAQPATNDLLRELEEARGELGQLRQKYAPDHPDVQRLEKRVASLEAAIASESKGTASGASASSAGTTVPTGGAAAITAAHPQAQGANGHAGADNPAYIQLTTQLSATENDLRSLEQQITEQRARVADYQHKINVSPEVEREYRDLNRDYESSQLKYQELRSKQMEAQAAQNLEADRKGERFSLIEPPLPPEEPVSPNRVLILVLGLVLTLGVCAGCAALLESTDETVRGRLDVLQLLKAAPLAIVPRILTEADVESARRQRNLALGATAAAVVVAIVATHFLVRPLDVVWYQTLRHLGL